MFIRSYLRASTIEQDANRANDALEQFAADHGQVVASTYTENASGTEAKIGRASCRERVSSPV